MTLSLWRYSHLVLALVASAFLLVASATGIILALEPIAHQTKGYAKAPLEKVSLATAIAVLQENYDEVFALEVESSGFVKASVLTEDFETKDIYVDTQTGASLGEVPKRPEIFSFTTNLHRSLFLKSLGRFFVGLVSLLLVLIAVTGLFLLARRQGGFRKFFSKVQKEYFEMRYHVILSRWFFVPILILAVTGAYLSAEKFQLLPSTKLHFEEISTSQKSITFENPGEIPLFQKTMLSQVRRMDFPFSDDSEDYFRIALKDREIQVNQHTGAIVASAEYPFTLLATRLSFKLHTGEGSVWWSIVLLLASGSVIFFMYSGFVMTLRRRKKVMPLTAMPHKDACEYIILVGSETGSSYNFANKLYQALTKAGKQVYFTELNHYETYAKAKQLLILTSTYGEGEPPTNARKFEVLLQTIEQPAKLTYAVIGFGSLEYPDYCQFAITIDALLQAKEGFTPFMPLYKIDNADFTDFKKWAKKYSEKSGINLQIAPPKETKKLKQQSFEVVEITGLNSDDTFLLRLRPKRGLRFQSGDLLSVHPKHVETARQYSIAKFGAEILLSIKKHEFGKVSSFLFGLNPGEILKAALEPNPNFHFPKKTNRAIFIANGTGIAPFLGMMDERKTATIQLLWGGRTQDSAEIYGAFLNREALGAARVEVQRCFSREVPGQYVQDLVLAQGEKIVETFTKGGVVMICGSLSMQHGVLEILEEILEGTESSLDVFIGNGQLKMDCY